jgi:hypothetical protein
MMRTFGKAVGGGRRGASREPVPLAAVVSRVEPRQSAVLVDLSVSGAQLRGSGLPQIGEAVSVNVDGMQAQGTVAWAGEELCGVAFDAPLPRFEVERLRRDATKATATATLGFGGIEEKLCVEDWISGLNS